MYRTDDVVRVGTQTEFCPYRSSDSISSRRRSSWQPTCSRKTFESSASMSHNELLRLHLDAALSDVKKQSSSSRDRETLCQFFIHTREEAATSVDRWEHAHHPSCCGRRRLIVHVEPCLLPSSPERCALIPACMGCVHFSC